MSTARPPQGSSAVRATLHERLAPLLAGDPLAWHGLPPAHVADFDALFGAPLVQQDQVLGAMAAVRRSYRDAQGRGLVVWSRQDLAVMVEASTLPPPALVAQLPRPDRILAHEILLPDHYAHEYLYCATGLVLTVAEPLGQGQAHIARCRGVAALASPQEFGPAYYLAFEDQISWAPLELEP